MKTPFSFLLFLFAIQIGAAQTTILIGAGVRNGDFNDDTDPTDQRTYEVTPFWENIDGAQTNVAARTNLVGTSGTRNHQISHGASQTCGQSTGHVLAEGDSFGVSYEWRDAFNWDDAVDQVRIILFVTDTDAIDGVRTTLATTDSGLSTIDATYETVEQNDFYVADEANIGKTVFVAIDTVHVDGNGFARLDDFELLVGPLGTDPLMQIESGDFVFGDLVHPSGASTSKTVTFRNSGVANSLTVGAVALTDDGGGIFSVGAAPANGTMIAPGETFEVVVTATGGGGFEEYLGEIDVPVTPSDQSATLPLSASISTGGEVFEVGSIVLVDYDDGVENDVHDASIRNGGFEDGVAEQTLPATPVWLSTFFPEGELAVGTLDSTPAIGLFHGQASGFTATVAGEQRVHPAQLIDLAEWTLEAGDTFDIEFSAMGGQDYDGGNPQVIIEIVNENGAFVNDATNGFGGIASRWLTANWTFADGGAGYETLSITTPEIQRGSPWIGNRARVRFLKSGLRTAFVNIDNVSIVGNFKRLVTNTDPLAITALDFNVDDQEVTIRFVNSGAASYAVQGSSGLEFTDNFREFPLDGSENRVSFPGEIEFQFEDDFLFGPVRFWRVVEQ